MQLTRWRILVYGVLLALWCISALFWERRPKLRYLPIVYCALIGLTGEIVRGERDWLKVVQTTVLWAVVGLATLLPIWIERLGRR